MNFYSVPNSAVIKTFGSDPKNGLSASDVERNRRKYGKNTLSGKKNRPLLFKIGDSLREPMLLILCFSFVIAFGANIGKFFKSGNADFAECFGILAAIVLSVLITLIMEGSSEKAFNSLNKIYDKTFVTVIRNGENTDILREDVVAGDIIVFGGGDKIIADGRIISADSVYADESALTGESNPLLKSDKQVEEDTPLAERENMLYSGTFITAGSGKMIVTAVGDMTEMGKIAGELKAKKEMDSPLEQKLSHLGKTITAIGIACSALVFIISLIKLILIGGISFESVEDLLISSIILIVAAVPEGLPTIVAVSLALNMIKLAKENALIKKMIATETAGAVSVICSDKTGTLTTGKMTVSSFYTDKKYILPSNIKKEALILNIVLNGSVKEIKTEKGLTLKGDGTEKALVESLDKKYGGDLSGIKSRYKVNVLSPFSSENKYMSTLVDNGVLKRVLIKGAPEKIIGFCDLSESDKKTIVAQMEAAERAAGRIICFAHKDYKKEESVKKDLNGYVFDGFAILKDQIRSDVKQAIKECKKAGIKVKILTGDNIVTATAVAGELGIGEDGETIINGSQIENVGEEELKKMLPHIAVIARSTPIIKLRVVKALKALNEVVAVTGDGINDAPALKHADVGIAMGISGSEIAKEAADVVLLDDGFSTIVKAVAFGRNVYKNLQRFILFQLSVNFSALLFITVAAFMGLPSPFNTLQLLFINVIMDGPPALTLGLEKAGKDCMRERPVERNKSIVSIKMLLRIIFNGTFVGLIMLFQYSINFLGVKETERAGVTFTLFIAFQLFNAFNCRELGSESIFMHLKDNKVMVATFICTFVLHVLIVQFAGGAFGVTAISLSAWVKTLMTAFGIIAVSEAYKLLYRSLKRKDLNKKGFGLRKEKQIT